MIVASGTVASTPVKPTDAQIRTAITADGASGSTAYYVVIAYVTIANGTTDIDASMIEAGEQAIGIADGSITASKMDFSTFGFGNYSTSETKTGFTWTNGKDIYQKTFSFNALAASVGTAVSQSFSVGGKVVDFNAVMRKDNNAWKLPYTAANVSYESGAVKIWTLSGDLSSYSATVTLFYTKS